MLHVAWGRGVQVHPEGRVYKYSLRAGCILHIAPYPTDSYPAGKSLYHVNNSCPISCTYVACCIPWLSHLSHRTLPAHTHAAISSLSHWPHTYIRTATSLFCGCCIPSTSRRHKGTNRLTVASPCAVRINILSSDQPIIFIFCTLEGIYYACTRRMQVQILCQA